MCARCCPLFAPVCLHLGFRILGRSHVSFPFLVTRKFGRFDLDSGPDLLLFRMSVYLSSALLSYISFTHCLSCFSLHFLDNLAPFHLNLVSLRLAFTAFWISLGLHFS